ncbi:MAG TPA: D-alanine--D-alanine ligase [Terriglobia bacterium]|nr:D-alanine--D-alanine ligase [Terriglobia bacterium]
MLKYRVLLLTHQDFKMPEDISKLEPKEVADWKTEYEIVKALENLGHEVEILAAVTEMNVVREALTNRKPHIVFNQLEEFLGRNVFAHYLLGYLQLIHQPYTGCSPTGLLLGDNKPLMKKVLTYHRVPIPRFAIFSRGRTIKPVKGLPFPLIVKSTVEHSSLGISQASVVTSDDKLKERIEFIHEKLRTDAMVEEYIEGRELYVGVLGNLRLETFPIWEIDFGNLPEGSSRIATEKIKWDLEYQKKIGIKTGPAENLPEGVANRIHGLSKRVYHILGLNGYARMDFRLTGDGEVYLMEPNPNPDLGQEEDFAQSAKRAGIAYEKLIQRIINLGLRY